MANKGKLYGIGIGPGDSELITIKASKILKKVDVICSPKSSPKKESIALSIAKPILEERDDYEKLMVVEPVFPMTENDETLEKHWKEASIIIADYLDKGKDVGFITLGDPSIFSTFSYVQKILFDNYETELVPGITSFTACASSINKPLVEKNEILSIVPKIDERLDKVLDFSNSIVLMKTSRNPEELENLIHSKEGNKEITSVQNATQKNQKIIDGFSKDKPYLCTTIVKLEK
ncbi:MAG: precorrin-2 C(20)-methyltransferase [Methanobacteriaceae archaeon]|jgi:precorrin-2/cobalt-factor-2 C20-methyltransferase|nr:precorrin-2 C(20)-methyltransferase [Methanobacteriaceae archaeon]